MDCNQLNAMSGGTVGAKPPQRKPCPPDDPHPDPDRPMGYGETAAGILKRVDEKALARALLAHEGHPQGYFDIPWLAELHPNEIEAELKRRVSSPRPEVDALVAQGINGWVSR